MEVMSHLLAMYVADGFGGAIFSAGGDIAHGDEPDYVSPGSVVRTVSATLFY